MSKQDFYKPKKLLHKLEFKLGDDSEYLMELANKINEEAAYHRCQLKQRSLFWTYLVINQSNFTEEERSLNQAI